MWHAEVLLRLGCVVYAMKQKNVSRAVRWLGVDKLNTVLLVSTYLLKKRISDNTKILRPPNLFYVIITISACLITVTLRPDAWRDECMRPEAQRFRGSASVSLVKLYSEFAMPQTPDRRQ